MQREKKLIERFETGLNIVDLEKSIIPGTILGYGEISTVFQIGSDDTKAYKRMPLFSDRKSADRYIKNYNEYCDFLREAGLTIPDDDTIIVVTSPQLTVLYIVQEQLPAERFCHKLLQSLELEEILCMVKRIVKEISNVWRYNESHYPNRELALDGQLSNWVYGGNDLKSDKIYYIDTGTPLYRINGIEQLDPELFLKSAPSFLRWIIRWLFLKDVMNRYYKQRVVLMDLAANLFKEQRPDLVPEVISIVNENMDEKIEPFTYKEIQKYYKEDKTIWTIFLAFRRMDQWIKQKILRKRYEFILPREINR